MKRLFEILPSDFFKPLTSIYRQEFSDCILMLYEHFKPEISYGVDREEILKLFMDYFELDDSEMNFDDGENTSDARDKANHVIRVLKECGWLEYENAQNHRLNIVLNEYSIPVIEGLVKIRKEDETEYQGLVSTIYACLTNEELFTYPYGQVILPVEENTMRLLSELKKLGSGIKRYMDKQTADMSASELLDHFFEYHNNIGSKAYQRMKTNDNVSFFRSRIIERLDDILTNETKMDRVVKECMESDNISDYDSAFDEVIAKIQGVKSSFYRLDEIIEEIERKHNQYVKNAVMRARFLLTTGNNIEGKISQILNMIAENVNNGSMSFSDEDQELNREVSVFSQGFLSSESLYSVAAVKTAGDIGELGENRVMSDEERALYKEALRERNRRRFTRKNINSYVETLLVESEKIPAEKIPVAEKRDLIRIIYIRLYAGHRANIYKIIKRSGRIRLGNENTGIMEFPEFDICRAW